MDNTTVDDGECDSCECCGCTIEDGGSVQPTEATLKSLADLFVAAYAAERERDK